MLIYCREVLCACSSQAKSESSNTETLVSRKKTYSCFLNPSLSSPAPGRVTWCRGWRSLLGVQLLACLVAWSLQGQQGRSEFCFCLAWCLVPFLLERPPKVVSHPHVRPFGPSQVSKMRQGSLLLSLWWWSHHTAGGMAWRVVPHHL